jgi:hypothetical protein
VKADLFVQQGCQKQAWKHHHKLECEMFKKIQADGLSMNHAKGLGLTPEFRAIIRLILLRKSGRISNAEWAELHSLQTGRAWRWQNPEWKTSITTATLRIAQYFNDKELDVEEITDLYCSVYCGQSRCGERY